jgi:DNA-binding NtrC family response regulator
LLIRGEPGAGKDTLARLIHADSPRRHHAFIKVSCTARPADRHEADLFGLEKGAPPLADRRRLGSLEFANAGTLYVDEIGALSRTVLPKLLQALELGRVSRGGGDETIPVDVRVIASTARSVMFDGLNVVEISIPPLRHRTDEIASFASFFLERFNRLYRRDVELCPDTLAAFRARPWPGNISELEEAVHQLVIKGMRVATPRASRG